MSRPAAASSAKQPPADPSLAAAQTRDGHGHGSGSENGPDGKRSWTRRLSVSSRPNFPALPALPHLPNLPHLPLGTPGFATLQNLRAALLGYLGEVEDSVRSLGDEGTPDSSRQDEGSYGEAETEAEAEISSASDGTSMDGSQDQGGAVGWSSGVAASHARQRKGKGVARQPDLGVRAPTITNSPVTSSTATANDNINNGRTNREALLAHLSTLRADVQAYLPLPPMPSFRVPSIHGQSSGASSAASAAGAAVAQTQDWLRNLPGRLRAVERALPSVGSGTAGLNEGSRLGELMSAFPFPSYAYGSSAHDAPTEIGEGDVRGTGQGQGQESLPGARRRLLEMVRSVLPSDEWEGWERLGWEETDLHPDDGRNGTSGSGRYRYGAGQSLWASGSAGTRLTRSLSHPARMQYPASDSWYGRHDSDDEDEDEVAAGEDGYGLEDDDMDETGEDETADDDDDELDGVMNRRRPHKHGSQGHARVRTRATSGFLFPNRTPAATEAIKRRRNVRSRSLGSAGHAGRWAALLGEDHELAADHLRPDAHSGPSGRDGESEGDGEDDGEGEGAGDRTLVEPLIGGIADPMATSTLTISPTKLKAPALNRNKSSVRIGYANEFGPSVAEALERSQDGHVLLTYEDLPVDWRNNEHVLTGYRFIPLHASTGPIPLIKSAFAWHNETLNIHTHFIPTVLVLCFIPFLLYSTPLPDAHPLDTVVLALYLVAAVSCMFSSAMWHILSGCASKKWFEWGACVDYIGISWLIAASFGTVVYNAFYCRPKLVYLYLGTNAACGALGSYLPFQRWFNMRRMKPWRIAFFLFLNFAMFAPLLQLFWVHGRAAAAFCAAFIPSILAYVAGLLFYAFHFPECVWPGKFDTWGASHQIWHTGIVLAIILHYRAVFAAHDMRHDLTCSAPGAGIEVGKAVEGWLRGLWA